ncbi:uncharacterized protein I303_104127 [Kwoniella dejecticola CBS 10117]|uniref:Protein HRI1 n=1 Tax=Kwoniella dejecticola CBS 10117 TaxID=1296121 RepID=A0A1A6A670_9TREE|nr:uncharacterized protein I303_04894 [Kwoniella dejecticola CBS 10117]OBR85558.1 hypothetical protein I303_04894 [Kwoniella dejecticola CBS 10117]
MAARVSTRVSIAWSGTEPIEDTDTLVLTIDGYSLDLRVFIDGKDKGSIDWSTVAHVGEIEGSTKENPKLRWDHIIDSRPETDMPDQGVFETLLNGNVTETGTMFNPKTNLYEPYVETWRRKQLPAGQPYFVIQSKQEDVQAYIGRVGNYALGLAKDPDGRYYACRDELVEGESKWKRIYEFGQVGRYLPELPVDVTQEWSRGKTIELGGSAWEIKTIGKL